MNNSKNIFLGFLVGLIIFSISIFIINVYSKNVTESNIVKETTIGSISNMNKFLQNNKDKKLGYIKGNYVLIITTKEQAEKYYKNENFASINIEY